MGRGGAETNDGGAAALMVRKTNDDRTPRSPISVSARGSSPVYGHERTPIAAWARVDCNDVPLSGRK